MISHQRLLHIILPLIFILSGCAGKDLILVREEAYLAYQNKDYQTAVSKFEILVEKSPEDVEFWFRLGNSYAKSKKPQLAVIAYQKALLRDPANEKAWYNMGIIQTQTALKTFVDMQAYTDIEKPIAKQGRNMREGLFLLLGNTDERAENK